ncbi:MAG TPA: FAD-dependent oxidoreductase, partial [Myxococcota bacterium]
MTSESRQHIDTDVVVIGGGPGGLQAALTLGRVRHDVVLFDAGLAHARNARAVHLQNFVTRDGVPPAEFRRIAHQQLDTYKTVQRFEERVVEVSGAVDHFVVVSDRHRVTARRVFLALGVVDELPPLAGIADIWGDSSAQCPFCHGYEVGDRRLATYTPSALHLEHAGMLIGWSRDVTALTNGEFVVDDALRAHVAASGVVLDERRIARLDSVDRQLTQIVFDDGSSRAADFLFTQTKQHQTGVVQQL